MNAYWLGVEVGVLKTVYYKLMGEGQLGPAQAIAQTIFEITEESDIKWDLFCLVPRGEGRASHPPGK